MRNIRTLAAVVTVALFLCGCAFLHSKTTRTYSILPGGTITNVTEKTVATAYTLWDANSSLAKFRNQSSQSGYGSNTFAPGTYMSALNESATSTNINDLVGTIVGAAVKAAAGVK
jgi:hypothetical protein